MKKNVLVVFPTMWDVKQLESCRSAWADQYDLIFAGPADADCDADFDVLAFIDRVCDEYGGAISGVLSSSDYPGATVAGAIAQRLNLPGTPPAVLLRCAHKYYSRCLQREAVPEATPWFALLDPSRPAAVSVPSFPCFVKPVKGAFSVLARRIEGPERLAAFLARPEVSRYTDEYLRIFNRLVARHTDFKFDGRYFIAEELLTGRQVTVEGFCHGGDVEILGIVDSVLHPATGSFTQFTLPSSLPANVQERMYDIACRFARAAGLRETLFNIEMVYDAATDRIRIIEVNPRLCGQFADLYEKVYGTHGYLVALALATGQRPDLCRGNGHFGAAASVPLRVFEPVRVLGSPAPERVRRVEAEFPETLVWNECASGDVLGCDLADEDGFSHRYAVVNLGAASEKELGERAAQIEAALAYSFVPLKAEGRPAA